MSKQIPNTVLQKYSSERSYARGLKMYEQGFVKKLDEDETEDMIIIEAEVESSNYDFVYDVYLEYNFRTRKFEDKWCDCPAFSENADLCKHCVAVVLALNGMRGAEEKFYPWENGIRATSKPLEKILYERPKELLIKYQAMSQQIMQSPVELVPILSCGYQEKWSVSFRIGTTAQYYVVKDLSMFVQAVKNEESIYYGKKLAFVHTRSAFAADSLPLLDFIIECVTQEQMIREQINRYYGEREIKRSLVLSTTNLFRLLRLQKDRQIFVLEARQQERLYQIVEKDTISLPILLQPEDSGYQLTIPPLQFLQDGQQVCLVAEAQFVFCSLELAQSVEMLQDLSKSREQKEYYIAEKDLQAFCTVLLPKLKRCSNIDFTGLEQFLVEPCQFRVYLDDDGMQILCKAEAYYGEQRYLLYEQSSTENFLRDWAQEYQLRALLEQYFPFCDEHGELYFPCDDDDRLYRLLTQGVKQIDTLAEVYLSDRMKQIQVQAQPKLQIGVGIQGGLLDLNIEAERLPQQELQRLLNSYRQRRKYYRMTNGDFLQLEEGPLAVLAELADGLELSGRDLQQGHLQIPQHNAYYVDQVLRDGGEALTVQRDVNFRSLIRNLKNYEDSDDEIPAGLQTTLRQYQQIGYQWLMSLTRMGLGGILADDMGLGKTVQIIALLLANAEKLSIQPALIVTPASLVYNWENELHRFAPSLTVQAVTGTAIERKQLLQQEAQIFLTSYDLLKRDVEQYQENSYSFLVIDEAQNIKNHTTKAAAAVKSLQAGNRFALTGTPIENRLSELWSIFDFLLPGMLHRYEAFRQNYELAIVQRQDEIALKRLQNMIRPFILRRFKQDVLKDLPEKIENVVYSKMESAQRELYVANLQHILDQLDKKTEAEVRSEKIQILAELTKLRQLCCDPSLLYESYHGGSAKLNTCLELLDSAVQAGSKVLVFSQFTTMLQRIKQQLDEKKIASFTLTGSTSKEQRASLVQRFNETEDASIFLISLKAGGTGLNLTAASVVIHVDPWWNAAVQEQATDRAHRIGQKQVVTVFKLITKDTIEEKIQSLQENKLALSDSIINAQGVSMASLSKEEIIDILQDSGAGL